jgi:D-citramalate synthase
MTQRDAGPGRAQRIEVMDTTLRDGEQTPDIAYSPAEKLQIARMLLQEVKVDRIEIAGTRVSEGERQATRRITAWARKSRALPRIEVLGYCDGKKSVDWITGAGGRVMNLLTKGSELHCRKQLGKTPEQHWKDVASTLEYAKRKRLIVNVYLEDWSQGVRQSPDYVFRMMAALLAWPVKRIYLPDTLGVLSPDETSHFVRLMTDSWPEVHFEFHAHNDYGLATANCLAAVKAGARGVHTSVNGMGERAGNTRLAEVVAAIHDRSLLRTGVVEARLEAISRMIETFSGKEVAANTPIVGRDVFTHTAGIHSDGDAKGELYTTALAPQRFGRKRRYAMGKLSGKASVDHNLKALGIELSSQDRDLVLKRIVELGDKKHVVGPEDLPYIIADVLATPDATRIRIEKYTVRVESDGAPDAEVTVRLGRRTASARATGDGGYDAFMNALKKAMKRFKMTVPRLVDFRVRIPPGGRTAALVETYITWRSPDEPDAVFTTLGVDSDQIAAAVIATEKMLNAVADTSGGA